MYLTLEEFVEYGGALDETTFNDLEFDAESTIDWYTFSRLKKPEWADALNSESLKRCMYQLIKMKQMENELLMSSAGGIGSGVGWTKEAGITQESNDGITTHYNTLSAGELLSQLGGERAKQNVVNKYLSRVTNELGRSLLYKGIYPGE